MNRKGFVKVLAALGAVAAVFALATEIAFADEVVSPAVEFRGVVEGYYGRPWGTEGRLSMFKFMGEQGLNVFIYGPKDDPYHRAKWREAYPEAEMGDFRKLLACAKENRIDFYWAVHVGGGFGKGGEADYTALFNKLGWMYDAGFRSFAVFFDDFGGANAEFHAEICNRVVTDFLEKKGDCSPLIMCPNAYSGFGRPYQKTLGEKLDRRVHVMWTGRGICSDITKGDLARITADLKRPPFVWWNWPVNDYCRSRLLLGRTYGLADSGYAGFVSNPMENCEASKIALYGIAKWAKDPAHFDSRKTWEETFTKLYPDPEVARAMRIFAEHNSDQGWTCHHYRREESVSAKELCARAGKEFESSGKFADATEKELKALFNDVRTASATLLVKLPRDQGLGWELEGWFEQEIALMDTGLLAIELMKASDEAARRDIARKIIEVRTRAEQAGDAHIAKFRAATFANDKGQVRCPEVSVGVLNPFISRILEQTLRRQYAERHDGARYDASAGFRGFSTAKSIENPQVVLRQKKYAGLERIFEPRVIAPGETFGIAVPASWQTGFFHARLGDPKAFQAGVIEFSKDGEIWTKSGARAQGAELKAGLNSKDRWRYVRYRNVSDKDIAVKIDLFKFDVDCGRPPIDELLRDAVGSGK